MAHQPTHGSRRPDVLRVIFILGGIFIVGNLLGFPLHEKFVTNSDVHRDSCPPCICDCSSESIIALPLDCGKNDSYMIEELGKGFTDLLIEELDLQKDVAKDNEDHIRVALSEAKKISSHYRREAEKCNAGMEICEEARVKAEEELIVERKLSEIWKQRAIHYGWNDKIFEIK